jgi:hypothetical protein
MNKYFAFPFLALAAMACFANFDAGRIEKVGLFEGSQVCGTFVQEIGCPKGYRLANMTTYCADEEYNGCDVGGTTCATIYRRETVEDEFGDMQGVLRHCDTKSCGSNSPAFCGSITVAAPACAEPHL